MVNSTVGGNDQAGNPRWIGAGGWRSSREFQAFHGYEISLATAYKPLFPIPFELIDKVAAPDLARRIGFQADVRMCNIANRDAGQGISIAGDGWYFFPWTRTAFLQNTTEESLNTRVAYGSGEP